jgi:acetyl-CoA carboxylase biotin carboxylase subunit
LFQKILIANRGEIALRIHRACHDMGILTVAVHSTADADAMHVRLADESVCIGPPSSRESYLNMPALLSAAEITGADAIHPGVGFLSENARFAEVVAEHGITFIGPSPDHMRIMGDKVTAKQTVAAMNIPVVRGSDGAVADVDEAAAVAKEIGYPILIKASSGGGGKGMKVAHSADELAEALHLAQSEARANFGDDSVYIERYLEKPRHIEIQLFGDNYGNAVHLGERDCSIQRRHQKLLEEGPSPVLPSEHRKMIGALAGDTISKLGYRGAGTMEFLYENGEFFFMEMNTRLQVEHSVTEMITGVDLVREQIRVAAGEKLSFTQDDIHITGHAIECRVNAENSVTFMPSPGVVKNFHAPGGPGVRIDSGLYGGYRIPSNYDSLIAKLIVHGADRAECIARLGRALEEFVVDGVDTTLPLHRRILGEPAFRDGNYDIHWLEQLLASDP